MQSVIVQRPAGPGDEVPESWSLGAGDVLTFGRGGDGPAVDVALSHPAVPRLAGEISACEDYWLLTNLGVQRPYVIENPEGGGEFIKVAPGRLCAPVPFEFARLMVPLGAGTADLLVFAPEHSHLAAEAPREGERTVSSFAIDESAKYFRVLVALCEPRLLAPHSSAVPSLGAVAHRLLAADGCEGISRAAVGFHVEYLARHKLRIREHEGAAGQGDAEERLDHKRQAIVALALRFDIVRPEHLRLLAS
jgi:hypothetical protein